MVKKGKMFENGTHLSNIYTKAPKKAQPMEKDFRGIRVRPAKWNSKGHSYVTSGLNKESSKLIDQQNKTKQTQEIPAKD